MEGMTDALRQRLEGISSLRVISRTSSMHYRGNGKPLPDIARELNIDAVVDGSVLRSGDRVRINVELIQARTDRHMWSNSYEGDVRDAFILQAGVAQKIADEIRVTLTAPERARLALVRATNPDAYQAYSKVVFSGINAPKEDVKEGDRVLSAGRRQRSGLCRLPTMGWRTPGCRLDGMATCRRRRVFRSPKRP